MGYIEHSLTRGEQIVHRAHKHWVVFVPPVLVLGAAVVLAVDQGRDAGLVVGAIGLALLLPPALHMVTAEYVVTTRRVVLKEGLVWRKSEEVLLGKIEGFSVDQGVVGRILGYGTIVIAGSGGTRPRFHAVAAPLALQRHVMEQIDAIEHGVPASANPDVPSRAAPRAEPVAALPAAPVLHAPAPQPSSELPRVWLMPRSGVTTPGGRWLLDRRKIRIGADADNDIVLGSPRVSGHHALLEVYPSGDVWVTDLGSRNGTFVNDRQLGAGDRVKVRSGDQLKLSSQVVLELCANNVSSSRAS